MPSYRFFLRPFFWIIFSSFATYDEFNEITFKISVSLEIKIVPKVLFLCIILSAYSVKSSHENNRSEGRKERKNNFINVFPHEELFPKYNKKYKYKQNTAIRVIVSSWKCAAIKKSCFQSVAVYGIKKSNKASCEVTFLTITSCHLQLFEHIWAFKATEVMIMQTAFRARCAPTKIIFVVAYFSPLCSVNPLDNASY